MQCHMLLWRYGATPSPRRRARDDAAPGWFGRVRRAWRNWRAAV